MRVIYSVSLKRKFRVSDAWPIPFAGGTMHLVRNEDTVEAIKIVLTNRDAKTAPRFFPARDGEPASIKSDDHEWIFVKKMIEDTRNYLAAFFRFEPEIENVKCEYEPEFSGEFDSSIVKSIEISRDAYNDYVPFDLIARAFFAGEISTGPSFETNLVRIARDALIDQKFIDAFRYSFMLIEATYGDGKFRTRDLVRALSASPELNQHIESAIQMTDFSRPISGCGLRSILGDSGRESKVIDYIVDRRGFYFHGNRKRPDSWHPANHRSAEHLAALTTNIALSMAWQSTERMFEPDMKQKFLNSAERGGYKVQYKISYMYRIFGENFDRDGVVIIDAPGSMHHAMQKAPVLQQFLQHFSEKAPTSYLSRAVATDTVKNQILFSVQFEFKD